MAWRVEFDHRAARELARLDRTAAGRIVRFLRERIAVDDDPRRLGQALRGDRRALWKYRVGDYRLICDIQDGRVTVLVLAVGHRREVYR